MQSSERLGCDTALKNGLSVWIALPRNMSKWRLLTGRSTGSHIAVAELCSQGEAWVSLAKLLKSSIVP